MDYGQWKRALDPWLLLLTGAGFAFALQKAIKAIKGLPPCEPDEVNQAMLNQLSELRQRVGELEKASTPKRERLLRKLQRLCREWLQKESAG